MVWRHWRIPNSATRLKAVKSWTYQILHRLRPGLLDYFCRCLGKILARTHYRLRNPAVLEEETMALRPAPQAKKVPCSPEAASRGLRLQMPYTSADIIQSSAKPETLWADNLCWPVPRPERRFPTGGVHGGENIRDLGVEIEPTRRWRYTHCAREKPDAVIPAIGSKPIILYPGC